MLIGSFRSYKKAKAELDQLLANNDFGEQEQPKIVRINERPAEDGKNFVRYAISVEN
jgi:hypothetical protein